MNINTDLLLAARQQVDLYNKMAEESVELRKATQKQVEATNAALAESHKQGEQSLMPILMLTTKYDGGGYWFILMNSGNGPAFNARIENIAHDKLTKTVFLHRRVIGAGEHEIVILQKDPPPSTRTMRPEEFAKLLLETLQVVNRAIEPIQTKILYEGVGGHSYETRLSLKLTNNELDIHFDRFIDYHGPRPLA